MRGWVRMFKAEAAEAVGKSQYGIARPGACVSLRHDLLLEWLLDPSKVLLGIDLENMHNTVSIENLEHQVAHLKQECEKLRCELEKNSRKVEVSSPKHRSLRLTSPLRTSFHRPMM